MILNLKKFNKHVTYQQFKMDTLHTITSLIKPHCFMASLDLKDAYHSVPIAEKHRKFLRFKFNGVNYQYSCFPNGLSCCPRLFTKLVKPALAELHKCGFIATAYNDDIYLQGNTYEECMMNVIKALSVFTKLGFIIHPFKSSFAPSQSIKMLGFILNSVTMTVTPTEDKKNTIHNIYGTVLSSNRHPIPYATLPMF